MQSFIFSKVESLGLNTVAIFYFQQRLDLIQLRSFTFSKVGIEYNCNLLQSATLGLNTIAIFYFQQGWDWIDRCGIGYADGCNLLHDQNVDRLV